MDNLSGGEKTVAALALLFSIHRSTPAITIHHTVELLNNDTLRPGRLLFLGRWSSLKCTQ